MSPKARNTMPVDVHEVLYRNVRIADFRNKRITDPRARHMEMPWQEYHTVRNAVYRVCKRHGTTGPMGECPIVKGAVGPGERGHWPAGDEDPDYFLVDDQLNSERYLYMEVLRKEAITDAWLADVVNELSKWPGWGIGITNIPKGYLLLFPSIFLHMGPAFRGTESLTDLVRRWKRAIS